jgi:3-methyladenine DNA glycosylase AlkD
MNANTVLKANTVLSKLERKGKANTEKTYRRHGVTGRCYGVSFDDIQAFKKSIQCDHALSLELWQSGVHDARVLATQVADASQVDPAELDRWLSEVDNYILDDAVAALAARSPLASEIARRWIKSPDEWRAAAGWNVIASLAIDGRLRAATAKALVTRIQKRIHRAKNRARLAMNDALIAIGGSVAAVREQALAAAKAIGKVEVDHGKTRRKTPDAARYIQRMAARASKKAAGGAKPSGVKSAAKAGKAGNQKASAKPRTRMAAGTAVKRSAPTQGKATKPRAAAANGKKATPARSKKKKAVRAA